MTERTCSVDGCEGRHYGKGWCLRHYTRMRRHGSLDDPEPPTSALRVCSIEGCDQMTGIGTGGARGWCQRHYQHWRKWGDPLYLRPLRNKGRECHASGCFRQCFARGLCQMHYTRVYHHGSLEHPQAWGRAPSGRRWCPWCRQYRDETDFYRSRNHAHRGVTSYCRFCTYDRRLRPPEGDRFSRLDIAERDGWLCQICLGLGRSKAQARIRRQDRWPLPRSLSIDHTVPRSKGGDDTRVNLQAAHLDCNRRKHTGGTDQLRLFG